MREIALLNPEKIKIIETNVDAETQLEFYEVLQSLGNTNTSNSFDTKILFQELTDQDTSVMHKKEILAKLVSIGEVESYRLIETYLKDPDPQLKSWAYLAYQQARMFLESNLLEESKIYIASGLGGKDHRLRYIFVFSSKESSYNKSQTNIIRGEIEYFLKKNDGYIEKLTFEQSYAICTILVAIHVDLIEIVQNIITEVNQYGSFLHENVFVTNEKAISISELESIFKTTKPETKKI
ncbi:MAG TPA: hypothetical protein PLL66_05390 [Bacteroidales bacterium]|nr:hypothetical protein [Bacteroidales bacterium]